MVIEKLSKHFHRVPNVRLCIELSCFAVDHSVQDEDMLSDLNTEAIVVPLVGVAEV
jgi:hypothetical protein